MRTRLIAGIAVASTLAAGACVSSEPGTDSPRTNVIVILTDDQTFDSIPRDVPVMPFLQERVLDPADDWIVFSNAFVNTPVCCPSRASMLTGRFAHHTGVLDNADGALLDEGSTLAAWLDDAGYHTGLVGKYLNGYPFGRDPFVPEGWDRWWGKQQGPAASVYHDFTLIEQGEQVPYGADAADYSTDVFAAKAIDFLREAPSDRPFFLWFAPTAPHPEWVSAPRHEGTYDDLAVPIPPSLGEADVDDKPAWVQGLPADDQEGRATMQDARRDAYETLLAVDEAVRGILDVVRERRELDETVIVYLSDNGFSFGEHRWIGKGCPYDECVRIPFLVRVPGAGNRTEPAMVSGVDLAPTMAELAGVTPPDDLDGTSLVPLLRDREHAELAGSVFSEWVGDERIPPWWELRTRRWAYVELATGERELYELRRDPYQLVNVADDPSYAPVLRRLSASLATYRTA